MTPHQRYEELWRELQVCDGLDYDYSFCVEHHFRPDESWISSPSVYIVGAAARTRKIRVGSCRRQRRRRQRRRRHRPSGDGAPGGLSRMD